MYETVFREIMPLIAWQYNVPKDIIQLMYNMMNMKHPCSIMITNEVERLRKTIKNDQMTVVGIKYYMLNIDNPISLKLLFIYAGRGWSGHEEIIDRDKYSSWNDIISQSLVKIRSAYACLNRSYYNYSQNNITFLKTGITEMGFNPNGFLNQQTKID